MNDARPPRKSAAASRRKDARKDARKGGVRAIGALTPELTRKALGKRGFTGAKIVTDWALIVGEDLARQSQPDSLRFPRGQRDQGVLTVRVDGPLATELMHLEPLVVERINGHFGYKAVARLKLVQAPVRRSPAGAKRAASAQPAPPRPAPRAIARGEADALEARLAAIEDPALRESLRRLGRTVLGRTLATKPDEEG
ncbi:MAG: DciA family protein [Alphaproteobacteria bacterium]|nr:DciA family protein [Alphaproteobacteria bacterium]